MNYDEWRLSGPADLPEPAMTECVYCGGLGWWSDDGDTMTNCHVCDGSGEVPVEAEEPDGDYEYERRRDAAIDRG